MDFFVSDNSFRPIPLLCGFRPLLLRTNPAKWLRVTWSILRNLPGYTTHLFSYALKDGYLFHYIHVRVIVRAYHSNQKIPSEIMFSFSFSIHRKTGAPQRAPRANGLTMHRAVCLPVTQALFPPVCFFIFPSLPFNPTSCLSLLSCP